MHTSYQRVTRSPMLPNSNHHHFAMLPYHDLLIVIFEYLSEDLTSLLRLSLVNRQTQAAAAWVLYKTVTLHELQSIDLFCTTILTGSQKLHPLIQSLWIGPPDHDRCPGIVALLPRIRETLKMIPRLRHLTLTPMAKSFGELFRGLLGCSFTLESLTVSYHTQHSFAEFLQSQPSITHLRLYDPDTEPPRAYNLVSSIKDLSATGPFLPHLEYISADPRVLASVIAGRPVSHVEIMVGACLSRERDELKKLVAALTQTAVPMTSITHTLRTARIHLWGNKFLQQLKDTSIHSTLRSLTIRLPQIVRPELLLRVSLASAFYYTYCSC
jgi:hypothetical protein